MASRSSQTDASSFNYNSRRKRQEHQIELSRSFDPERLLTDVSTQTEWSPFIEIPLNKVTKTSKNLGKYNLRSTAKK